MKKKKLVLYLLIIVGLLTGCSKKAVLKNGSTTAVKLKEAEISTNEYYETIKTNNISKLVDMIDHKLFDEKYPSNSAEKEAVEEQISQMKKNYDTEEAFLSILKQYFGMSSQKELEDMLKLEYKRKLAVLDYLQETLTDKEISNYYTNSISGEIKASHILITIDANDKSSEEEKQAADKDALNLAKSIIKRLNDGEDFNSLAKQYSKDTASAKNNGSLGYFQPQDMVEEFREAVKNLEVGKYSKEPVKTKYGYHIILKEDEKEKPALENVLDKIKETLANEKLNSSSTVYYKTLIEIRKSNEIEWGDDELKKEYDKLMDTLINQES